ncbi:hypothetical protein P7C70_g3466, partial [Phenoliferia sp. Uapishka_3]
MEDSRDLAALRQCWLDVTKAWRQLTPTLIRQLAPQFQVIAERLACRTEQQLQSAGSNGTHSSAPVVKFALDIRQTNVESHPLTCSVAVDPATRAPSTSPCSADFDQHAYATAASSSIAFPSPSPPPSTSIDLPEAIILCIPLVPPHPHSASSSRQPVAGAPLPPPIPRFHPPITRTSVQSRPTISAHLEGTESEGSGDEEDRWGIPHKPAEVSRRANYTAFRLQEEAIENTYGLTAYGATTFERYLPEVWWAEKRRRVEARNLDTRLVGRKRSQRH